jgi:hypothetical protein
MKKDLKVLKETQQQYSCETNPAAKEKAKLVDLINCCESIMSKGVSQSKDDLQKSVNIDS